MIIDTEGYDGATLLNSNDFLNARIARINEFEYHNIGMWGPGSDKVQLKQLVDTLDAAGYSCYLQGKDGTLDTHLYKLTSPRLLFSPPPKYFPNTI